jgi:EAL and modified HD-GYP domain-containing signal transduction protein
MPMRDVYIGRQPIYDRRLEVYGYELALQPASMRGDGSFESGRAAAQLVLDTLVEIGLDAVVGDTSAFLRVPSEFVLLLLGELAPALPKERLVLLLDQQLAADPSVREVTEHLVRAGFRVAIDDIAGQPVPRQLLQLADLARVDVRGRDAAALRDTLASLQRDGVQVLASGVETYRDFARCRDLGFDYFQGPFLFRPDVVTGRSTSAKQAPLLLLTRLHDPEADFAELEALVSQDVGLTYKLLRLVNSVWYGRRTRIESVRQALLLLGTRLVSAWLSLIVMSGVAGKPHELMSTAVVRARMCEVLAGALGRFNRESAFLVGLLSVLDVLLDLPMEKVVELLPLSGDVSRALLAYEGELGQILACVLAYEQADWSGVEGIRLRPGLVTEAFLDSVDFAHRVRAALKA